VDPGAPSVEVEALLQGEAAPRSATRKHARSSGHARHWRWPVWAIALLVA